MHDILSTLSTLLGFYEVITLILICQHEVHIFIKGKEIAFWCGMINQFIKEADQGDEA